MTSLELAWNQEYIRGLDREAAIAAFWSTWRPPASNTRAKLSIWQAREIRHLYATGNFTHRQLAKRYGVTETTTINIVNHNTYREVA